MKPLKRDFGWRRLSNWEHGDLDGYLIALKQWEETPRAAIPGRLRKVPIHTSWTPYLVHFNPSDPTRSQGAFARWLGVNPATVSAAKRKPITPNMAYDIEAWAQSMEG